MKFKEPMKTQQQQQQAFKILFDLLRTEQKMKHADNFSMEIKSELNRH